MALGEKNIGVDIYVDNNFLHNFGRHLRGSLGKGVWVGPTQVFRYVL
jgi:hypothetical protein